MANTNEYRTSRPTNMNSFESHTNNEKGTGSPPARAGSWKDEQGHRGTGAGAHRDTEREGLAGAHSNSAIGKGLACTVTVGTNTSERKTRFAVAL